ncbi:acyl carrier protein [Roseimarinus sediminis]|uniref:acyl carrier protein n=1 Tax=Roseimarinus sediminis TaxID=1610899 RepID=UPI003D20FF14
MNDREIFDGVCQTIQTVLKLNTKKLDADSGAGDIEGWDSLHHMMIITGVEEHFSVRFDFMEVLEMKTIGDICTGVKKQKTA